MSASSVRAPAAPSGGRRTRPGRGALNLGPDRPPRLTPCGRAATEGRPATNGVGATAGAARVFHWTMDDQRPDDAALAARLAADLDGTFEALVLAHQDRLFTIALRTGGDRHDAEELVQDAFVRAYRALAG